MSMPRRSVENGKFEEQSWQRGKGECVKRSEILLSPTRSSGNPSKKSFPSKWDDAEKWLMNSSCHGSPAQVMKSPESSKIFKRNDKVKKNEKISEISIASPSFSMDQAPQMVPSKTLPKDKLTNIDHSNLSDFSKSNPQQELLDFRNSGSDLMEDIETLKIVEIQHRDIGTEITPFGSLNSSRYQTPLKRYSPARHNTPADRSGLLLPPSAAAIDASKLCDKYFSEPKFGHPSDSIMLNWRSREEEWEEISKSLRHFEMDGRRKSALDSKAFMADDERRVTCSAAEIDVESYQAEEAKIQAWVNLQSAKAEAQSRNLEVKIQKMRSNLEEKLNKRMVAVHKRAEQLRAAARLRHLKSNMVVSPGPQKPKVCRSFCFSHCAFCTRLPDKNHYH